MIENLTLAFGMVASWNLLIVVLASGVYGIFIGSIPGLTATLATALLVPFAYFLDPLPAVASIITMSAMAIFAGDIPSALVRMPGTPASAAYVEDSYRLTQSGKGALALGVGLLASATGGIIGGLSVMFAAPQLAKVALLFTSYEYFWVAVLGLTAAVIISRGSQIKGTIALLLGQAARTLWRYKRTAVSGNAIGIAIGALPGAGSDIAAWVSYAVTKNSSKEGKFFGRGTGHIQPIVGCGSANNAGISAAFIPTLVFGIPGDTVTAILLGILIVKGIQPGPALFDTQAPMLYSIFIVFIVANILLIPLGYLAIRGSGMLLRVPSSVLMPIILAFCVVGSFSINNGLLEVIVMLCFGILGYVLERADFPLAPVVLGLVLGPIVEKNFMQSVIKTRWDLSLSLIHI